MYSEFANKLLSKLHRISYNGKRFWHWSVIYNWESLRYKRCIINLSIGFSYASSKPVIGAGFLARHRAAEVWICGPVKPKVIFAGHIPWGFVKLTRGDRAVVVKKVCNLPPGARTPSTFMTSHIHVLDSLAYSSFSRQDRVELGDVRSHVICVVHSIGGKTAGDTPVSWLGSQIFHLLEGKSISLPVGVVFTYRTVFKERRWPEFWHFSICEALWYDQSPDPTRLGAEVTVHIRGLLAVIVDMINLRGSRSKFPVIEATLTWLCLKKINCS